MTAATGVYMTGLQKLIDGTIDPTALGVLLVTDSYTPNFTTHDFRDDITNEVGNSGTYSAGGSALSGEAVVIVSDTVEIQASNPSWTSATITARAAIIYHRRGGAASADELLLSLRFTPNADVSSTNGTFTVDLAGASGTLVIFDTSP